MSIVWGSNRPRVRAATNFVKDLNTSTLPEGITKIGPPTYDPRAAYKGRLWALGYVDADGFFKTICYSDDWGDTWVSAHATAWESLQPTIHITSDGHFVWSTGRLLLRTSSAGVTSNEGGWQPPEYDASTGQEGATGWSYIDWTWGEFADGDIVTATYATAGNATIVDAEENELSGQYFYISDDGGATWTTVDTLLDIYPPAQTTQHIHSLHVDPYTNKLWVLTGDGVNASVRYSEDKGTTWSDNIDTESSPIANTGLTFTSDGPWLSSDRPLNQNYIQRFNGTNFEHALDIPEPYGEEAIYFIRAVGDNEFWAIHYNQNAANHDTWLIKFRRVNNTLEVDRPYRIATNALDGMNLFGLSHLNGIIPEWSPYVFVYEQEKTGPQRLEGTLRVAR